MGKAVGKHIRRFSCTRLARKFISIYSLLGMTGMSEEGRRDEILLDERIHIKY